jgi:AAA ATPase domain
MGERFSCPVLVGRDAEVAQLKAAIGRAAAGQPVTVLVAGEAGIGKTRLVPELGPAAPPQAEPPTPSRLFELLLGVLHRLAERTPVLLVAEDLHWADQSTRDLLGFLVRNIRGGVALVLTVRSDGLHRGHPLRPFLAELDRTGRAERLEVGRLGRSELTELLTGILSGPPAPGLAGEILARSGGNPFFAEQLLAAHQEGTRLPAALRDLLLEASSSRANAWRHPIAATRRTPGPGYGSSPAIPARSLPTARRIWSRPGSWGNRDQMAGCSRCAHREHLAVADPIRARGSRQDSRVRRNARVRAPSGPPVYSPATKSVTPASASALIWPATVSSSPTMATSAGPAAPSRSSMAR